MNNKFTNLKTSLIFHCGLPVICLAMLGFMLLLSCEDSCEVEQTYTYYEPVYTSLDELRSSVDILPAEDIKSHGKIFFKDNRLFINEPNEGVHIIDNSNPSDPKNVAFIKVPGSFDLVVKDNLLYTDSYIDLVIIDISDINNAHEVGRIEGLFNQYNSYGFYAQDGLGVVTDWKEIETVSVTKSDCKGENYYPWGMYYEGGIALDNFSSMNKATAVSPSNPGMAGSMSRFALAKNHLFVIDQGELLPFSLASPENPLPGEKQYIDGGIETLFPSGNNLFIGAQSGMHIMDLSNPLNPSLVSTYSHIQSCDPVIVDGDYAFVTLRSGSTCQGFTNQLEVINISDLTNPDVEHIYSMANPHGLGKDGDALFICDGEAGLKIYDASDIGTIDTHIVAHYKNIQAFDIIPFNKTAMMIGEDGLFQYDYSDLENISLLSHINIGE